MYVCRKEEVYAWSADLTNVNKCSCVVTQSCRQAFFPCNSLNTLVRLSNFKFLDGKKYRRVVNGTSGFYTNYLLIKPVVICVVFRLCLRCLKRTDVKTRFYYLRVCVRVRVRVFVCVFVCQEFLKL